MSDKQKHASASNGRKFHSRKSGGNGTQSGSQQANSADKPSVLRWGENTNIREFTKQMLRINGNRFGIMAWSVIDNLQPPSIPEIDRDSFDFEDDPYNLNRDEYRDRCKERRAILQKWGLEMPKLYSYTLMYLSNESLDAVKGEPEYDQVKLEQDPVGLWKMIVKTYDDTPPERRQRGRKQNKLKCETNS